MLRIETGMHAATVRRLIVDSANQRLFTTGDDRVVRVWQLPEGRLANVLRFPIGAGHEGRIFAMAVSPDGRTVAAAGWTGWDWDQKGSIYFFDVESGEMIRRVGDLPQIAGFLRYSADGKHLAVGLQANGGLLVYRTGDYTVVARDAEYFDKILGADFARDGRLAVASLDGFLRIYSPDFKLIGRKRAAPGTKPLIVRFSPDGERLAVSFFDVTTLGVFSSKDFSLMFSPDTREVTHQTRMADVAWSDDGETLYGCGDYAGPGDNPIYRWRSGGRGPLERILAAKQRITDLQTVPGGGVAFTAEDPAIGLIDRDGRRTLYIGPELADFRDGERAFRVSEKGDAVEFAYEARGGRPARFVLAGRTIGAASGDAVAPAIRDVPEFALGAWKDATALTINGRKAVLDDYEFVRSHAASADRSRLIVGTEWALRAYDRGGNPLWKIDTPGVAWNVAVTGDGRSVLATLGDGTIRWYRLDDGVEYLALFPHAAGEEWIAFTPQGYYVSSNYGDNFVGWHLNRGKERSADFFRAVQFERILYRPDVVDAWFASRGRETGVAARGGEAFEIKDLVHIAPPRIRIGKMTPGRSSDGAAKLTVAFEVEKNSLPMRDYAVYVNNIPVTPTKERRLSTREDGRFAREVEFELQARESVIRIEVNNGRSVGLAEKAFSLREAAIMRPAPGDLYLLAVGVNHFPKLVGADLAFAARDAEQLERFFASDGKRQYARVHTKVLSDVSPAKPERAAILDALAFISAAGPRDTVIVFLASHGISDPAGNYYFVPRDATGEDVDAVIKGEPRKISSLIGWSSFFEALRGVAGRRLLIVDTCQAKNIEGKLDVHSLSKRSASSLFSVVVASKGNEESQEYPPGQHGLFTYAMLNSLRGPGDVNRDGVITLNEMFASATPVVDQLRNRVLGPQSPQILAPEPLGNMVLVRAGSAAPAASAPAPVENAACGVRTLLVGARDPRCTAGGGPGPAVPAANTGCGVRNLVVGAREPNCVP